MILELKFVKKMISIGVWLLVKEKKKANKNMVYKKLLINKRINEC